jgi:hypothetical protein
MSRTASISFVCLVVALLNPVNFAAEPAKKLLHEQQGDYANVERLSDAIDILNRKLEKLGMADYAKLIDEESVKRAIKTSVLGHERSHQQVVEKADAKTRRIAEREAQRFRTVIKPLFDDLVKTGKWPAGAFFQHAPKTPHYFTLNLHVDTRDVDKSRFELARGKPVGYAIEILKIERGFAGPNNAVVQLK